MNRIMPGAEPYFMPGGEVGCLLLHGFTGTPFEMRELGEFLAEKGYSVLAPRLFAHATRVQDMVRARWKDWVASAEDGYHLLRGICSRVIVMGLSMGGALSLYLSSYLPISGVVAMSTPHVIPNRLANRFRPLLPTLSLFWRYHRKGSSDWRDLEAEALHIDYDRYPVRGGPEVDDLLSAMRTGLTQLHMPVLLIFSKGDLTVTAEHAHAIHQAIPAQDKQLLWVQNSGHVVCRDAERQVIFEAAAEFAQKLTGITP